MQAPIDDNDDDWRVEKVAVMEYIRAKCHGITSLGICAVGDSVLSHHVVQVVLPEHMVACCPRSLDCGFFCTLFHTLVKASPQHFGMEIFCVAPKICTKLNHLSCSIFG